MSRKVALVTGASRGIGAAIARRLSGSGCAVAVNYNRSEEAARRLVEELRAAGGEAGSGLRFSIFLESRQRLRGRAKNDKLRFCRHHFVSRRNRFELLVVPHNPVFTASSAAGRRARPRAAG